MKGLEQYIGKKVQVKLKEKWPIGLEKVSGVVLTCDGPENNEGSCDSISLKDDKFRYTVFEDEIVEIEVLG